MESSFVSFLEAADGILTGSDEVVRRRDSVEILLCRVGSHILGFPRGSVLSLHQLRQEFAKHFGRPNMDAVLSEGPLSMSIEACLCVAVSERNADRTAVVQSIMGMSDEDRVNLMLAIKSNMSDSAYSEEEGAEDSSNVVMSTARLGECASGDDEDDDESFDECNASMATIPINKHGEMDLLDEGDDRMQDGGDEEADTMMDLTQQPSPLPPMRASFFEKTAAISMVAGKCKPCANKDSALKQLTADLEAALSKAHDVEIRLKGEIAVEKNKLVDSELQIIDREQLLKQKDQDVAAAKKRISELEAQLAKHTSSSQELMRLQDEVDVLRPKAEKADQAEVQIERLRSRLEELIDVRQQLKSETAAHTETYQRLVACEAEIESLHACRKQLEEYRAQYTESLLQVDELTKRLAQRDAEVARYMQDNESLGGTCGASLMQTQHLVQELRATAEQLRQVERSNGIGEGMTEFNPALMQELTKLRKENTELAGKLDATSLESLTRFEKELTDQRCMVSSLQQKLFDTKDSLSLALATIVQLNSRISALEGEKRDMLREAAEAQSMELEHQETFLGQRERTETLSRKRQRDALALAQFGHAAVTFELSHELQETGSKLAKTTATLQEVTSTKNELEEANAKTLKELQHAREVQEQQVCRHAAETTEMSATHSDAMEREAARLCELEVDLEEERRKRRKVEREKKFFESEAKNNKNQLLVAGGAGGGGGGIEVESALRELKTMQTALDAANAEITALRATGCSSAAQATAGDAGNASGTSTAAGGLSSRSLRVKTGAERESTVSATATTAASFSNYFEHNGLVEKRLEQADRERRQLIAQNLEESKNKMELQQKLLMSEKEVAALKREKSKLTLEKERLHSQLSKLGKEPVDAQVDENANINTSPLPTGRATRGRCAR